MLGICKGLHYSLWMQDKLLLKEQTVARICNILLEINDDTLIKYYIFGMFEILAREWDKLDNWRIDKFMLLARDFFNHGLLHFTQIKSHLWDSFIEGLFAKIMNKDFNHAVGLKMHCCNLLGEELYKKKVKPIYVQSIFKSVASLLATLPKHNIYSHAVLKLTNQLSNTLKKYPISLQEETTVFLTQLISRPFPFRNALKSTNNNLKSAITKKQKLLLNKVACPKPEKLLAKSTVCPIKEPLKSISQVPSPDLSHPPTEIPVNVPKPVEKVKKTKKLKKKKMKDQLVKPTVGKKRKLVVSPAEKPKKSSKKLKLLADDSVNALPKTSSVKKNDEKVIKCQAEVEDVKIHVSDKLVDEAKTPKKMQLCPQPPSSDNKTLATKNDQTTTPVLKRRVSFGKVFRKKFDAARGISMTLPVNSNPVKGILRTEVQNSNGGRGRLSL